MTRKDLANLPTSRITEGELKNILEQMRKLMLVKSSEVVEVPKCMVCITEFVLDEEVRMLKCFHRFHKNCID